MILLREKPFQKICFAASAAGIDPVLIEQLVADASRVQQEGQTKIAISRQLFEQIQAALMNYQMQKQQLDGLTVDRLQSTQFNMKTYRELVNLQEKQRNLELSDNNNVFELQQKKADKDEKYGHGFRDYGIGVGTGALGGGLIAHGIYQGSKKHDATTARSPWLYRNTQPEKTNKKGEKVPARQGLGLGTKQDHRAIKHNKGLLEKVDAGFTPPINENTNKPYAVSSAAYKKAKADYDEIVRKASTRGGSEAKIGRAQKRINAVKKKTYGVGIAGGAALGIAGAGIYGHLARKRRERQEQEASRSYARGMNKDGASKFRAR